MTNLITLDGTSFFPKSFIDLKAFHSNKAQVLNDTESSQEDIDKTGHLSPKKQNAGPDNPVIDVRLLGGQNDNLLLQSNARNVFL